MLGRLKQIQVDLKILLEVVSIAFVFVATFVCVEGHFYVPAFTFFVILVMMILFLLGFLLSSQGTGVVCFWVLWIFWMLYSFGYQSTRIFVESWVWRGFAIVFANLFYLVSLVLSMDKTRAINTRLIVLFALMCFIDIIPLDYNNTFGREKSWPILRSFLACTMATLLNFQYRNAYRQDRDTAMRYVIQVNYIFFSYVWLLIPLFLLHLLNTLIVDRSFFTYISHWKQHLLSDSKINNNNNNRQPLSYNKNAVFIDEEESEQEEQENG